MAGASFWATNQTKILWQWLFRRNLNQNYAKTKIEINKNISALKSYLGVDLNFETFKSTPELDTDLNNNVYNLNLYYSNNLELGTYFKYNTLNKAFFATEGSSLEVRFSRALQK